jgi:PAS domain S-box-containing protein
MSLLDERTLYVAFVVVFVSLCLALLVVWRQTPAQRGLGRLAAAFWLMAAGVAMVALLAGLGDALLVVGNSLVVLGAGEMVGATRQFFGRGRQRWLSAAAASVAAATSAYFVYVDPDLDTRIVLNSLVLAGLAGHAAWVALRHGLRAGEGPAAALIAAGHGCASLVLAARAALTAGGVAASDALGSHWPTNLAALLMILAGLGTTLGFVTVANRRLVSSTLQTGRRLAESEERYRSLVEASPDVLYRTDARGCFTYCNAASERLLGYPRQEILGRRYLDFIRPDYRSTAAELYVRQARERVASTYFEFPVIRHDGGEVWVGQNVQRLGEGAELLGFEAVARDITERKRGEQALAAEKELLSRLVAVARATAEGGDLEATLQKTLVVASSLTQATGGSLFLLDEGGKVTRGIHAGGTGAVSLPVADCQRMMEQGLGGWVARHQQATLVADTLGDPRWLHLPALRIPVRSALSVPIAAGPALVGVLTLVHPEPGRFDEEDLHLMVGAAAQIALSLRNAQVSAARLELASDHALLFEALDAASRHLDPDELAEAAAEAIARRTDWRHVVVAVPGKDGFWRLHGRSESLAEARLPLAGGVIGRAYSTGEVQAVPDVSRDADYRSGSPLIRSELAVPLRYRDRILGVLNLESETMGAFAPKRVRLAESLAGAIALGLQNALLYEAMAAQRARLEAVIRSSRDGLVLADTQGRLLLVSEPAVRLLGLEGGPQDWFGHTDDTLVGRLTDDRAPLRAALLEPGDSVREGECAVGPLVIHWVGLPVPALGRLLVLRDVTRERAAEQMREDLTRTMVHDLRAPLTAMLAAVGLARTAPQVTREQEELLAVAESNARRQLRLIEAILDIDRLEQGGFPLERSRFGLGELVDEVLQLAAPRATAAGVALRATVSRRLPPVWADRHLVGRVLENLVGNAIQFSGAGGAIRLAADSPDGAWLRLTVEDSGPGVPAVLRPRLFHKFAAGGGGHGSGLGLAFCRLAVRAHGGDVWLEPDRGDGAVFAFTLPVAPGAERPAGDLAAAGGTAVPES